MAGLLCFGARWSHVRFKYAYDRKNAYLCGSQAVTPPVAPSRSMSRGQIRIVAALALLLAQAIPAGAQKDVAQHSAKIGAEWLAMVNYKEFYTKLDFQTYSLEYEWRPLKGNFAAAYNYPTFGVGISYSTLSNVLFAGAYGRYADMVTAYGSFSRDLLAWERLSMGYNFSLGIAYTSEYFDALANQDNWFIGAPVLFHVSGGGHVTLKLTDRFGLEARLTAGHNSNARFAYPNSGLNYMGGGLSAKYTINPTTVPKKKRTPIPETDFAKGWHYEIYAGGGVHACAAEWLAISETVDNETLAATKLKRWPMASLSFDAIYRVSGKFACGATADAFYASNYETLRWADSVILGEESERGYSPFSGGVGLVQEIFYRNTALYLQECIYLYRKMGTSGYHGPMYERAGLRFYPPKISPLFISVCIKAHLLKADYADIALGVRF